MHHSLTFLVQTKETPLHLAIYITWTEAIVRILLHAGANVNVGNQVNMTSHRASQI
jgi:uncharacterized protein (DUF486 family)